MPIIVLDLLFVLIGFGSDIGDPLYAVGGLIQRALIAVAFGWMTVTGGRRCTLRRLLVRPSTTDDRRRRPV